MSEPVIYDIACEVAGCTRTWHVEGPKSGFIVSGARSHIETHKREAALAEKLAAVGARRVVPFQAEFYPKLRSGEKTATTRPSAIGKVGEKFLVLALIDGWALGYDRLLAGMTVEDTKDMVFEITAREKVSLADVALHHFREEGVDSPEAFVKIWERLHPYVRFQAAEMKIFHRFRRVA